MNIYKSNDANAYYFFFEEKRFYFVEYVNRRYTFKDEVGYNGGNVKYGFTAIKDFFNLKPVDYKDVPDGHLKALTAKAFFEIKKALK